MKKLPLLLCILLMTGCVGIDNQSRMNAYFASMILGQQQGGGATEFIQFTNENGELTNDVPSIVLSSDTKEATFTFETPYKWSVDEETLADWISLSKTSGKAGKVELIITFDDNTSCNARDAVINIKSGDYTYHIKVHQDGNGASVDVSDDTETTTVTVTPADPESKTAEAFIPVEEGFSESKPTVIEIEGVGNITFDAEATAKILANAQAEGATNVYFKVEDVTTTKPVPNADVVLEVTMKTVDENGVEVYRKGKAAGEVTIEIPMDEDVVYVNSVTLVDDAGEPIEGGVIPGSEKIENGILSFKVNHFSKYAVDYVTKEQFVEVTGVSLDIEIFEMTLNPTDLPSYYYLTATIEPADATNKNVTWSSSNPSVATVDSDGNLTMIAEGETVITVTTEDGGKTATCELKVIVRKSMAELLANTSIPESNNTSIPADAWVSSADPNCKAYIGVFSGKKEFALCKGSSYLTLSLNDPLFEEVDDNTYKDWEPGVGIYTICLTDGKITSLKFEPTSDSRYAFLGGTYAALPLPDGALAGSFTVNAKGKKVYFSKGNLYADGDKALHFEAKQYSFANSWNASHVSHFTWSSTVEAAVGESFSGDNLFCDEIHKVSVDGSEAIYYALSKDEWTYLFNTRPNASIKVGFATVVGIKGIILLPDDFTDPNKSEGTYAFTPSTILNDYSANMYSITDWSAMESAGAVFLPTAGYRDGSNVCFSPAYNGYWSSSIYSDDLRLAYIVNFSSSVDPSCNFMRYNGCSVRLVTEGAPAGSTIEDFNMKGNDSDNWN